MYYTIDLDMGMGFGFLTSDDSECASKLGTLTEVQI